MKGFSPLSTWRSKQANSDPAVKWAHFQSLEGLSFDIPNKGCSSLITFTLFVQFLSVFLQTFPYDCFFPFFPIWNGSAINMQTDLSANTGMMSPMSHVCHKNPFFWSCPSKGLRHFRLQICIGHRKQHVGWTRKKKRSCLVSVCDVCLGVESAELVGNPIVETQTSQL